MVVEAANQLNSFRFKAIVRGESVSMPNFSDEQIAIIRLFTPYALDKLQELERLDGRFVHYTSADVGTRIIQNRNVWMRNARTMNDFLEVEHGKQCIITGFNEANVNGRFREFLNRIYPGISGELEILFSTWLPHFEQDTYLTSLSEHDPSEDNIGRLSMWRAYAPKNGVALVLKNTPLLAATDELGAFSSPVLYKSKEEFSLYFQNVVENIMNNEGVIRSLSKEILLNALFVMIKAAVLSTKHPGFKEEREWRIFYSPTHIPSNIIEPEYATIAGIPQEIYKIPLKHDPENGLHHADIPSILDRVIIGPTEQPLTIWKTFVRRLTEAGVQDAEERVIVSEIPLRVS